MAMPDYTVSGTGKVTVFLLHGIYGSKEYWRPQTERLVARGYRVVAWDAPGYGLSPLPDPFTFDVVAEAGAQLIRALGSERNVFHGHSMGGQITPRVRLKAPALVHGIVISSTIGYFANRTPEEQQEFVRKRTAPPPPGTDPVTANMMVVDSMLGPASRGPEVDLVRLWASRTPPETVKAAVKAVQTWPEAEAIAGFKAVDVPALLVAGEADQVGHPAGMKRVVDMIAGTGEIPLARILDALPEGLPIGVEAPCAQDAALPVTERARRCGEATHRFLEQYRRSPVSGSPDV